MSAPNTELKGTIFDVPTKSEWQGYLEALRTVGIHVSRSTNHTDLASALVKNRDQLTREHEQELAALQKRFYQDVVGLVSEREKLDKNLLTIKGVKEENCRYSAKMKMLAKRAQKRELGDQLLLDVRARKIDEQKAEIERLKKLVANGGGNTAEQGKAEGIWKVLKPLPISIGRGIY